MSSGVFLSRVPAAAGAPHPVGRHVAGEQLPPSPGHGGGVHTQKLCDLGVPAMADLERLQPGVQPPLAFVEEAVEQHDGGFELVG
jgi:hypothetical protein